jgi:hypothetical protein
LKGREKMWHFDNIVKVYDRDPELRAGDNRRVLAGGDRFTFEPLSSLVPPRIAPQGYHRTF